MATEKTPPSSPAEITAALKEQGEHYLDLFSSTNAYIELTFIGVAVAAGIVFGTLFKRFIARRLGGEDVWNIIQKPLDLLLPLFTVIGIAIITPMLKRLVENPVLVFITMQVVLAWLLVLTVLMLVKNRFMARFISGVMILLLTLDVFHLLAPMSGYLNSIGFSVGDQHFTLLGLLQGIIIFVIVFWAATSVSSLTESHLRRNTRLNYNARELIVKFLKILIFFIAVVITLTSMGVDLTAFAVFGGALGVGIGLGLQKITSNFVAGITLLMEKSIRQGDLVEIDTIFGYVRELNIRATLIETFNGQEVLVPNETLISSNLINWTMSSREARVEVPVGVAYGSDYKLVKQLILQAASEHSKCLKEPEPNCYMRNFGDSSVDFLLVFWVGDVTDGRWGPQSDVMFRIAELFDEHGISIPFPQRDLHVISGNIVPASEDS